MSIIENYSFPSWWSVQKAQYIYRLDRIQRTQAFFSEFIERRQTRLFALFGGLFGLRPLVRKPHVHRNTKKNDDDSANRIAQVAKEGVAK